MLTSLHHLIDGEWMREAYRRTRKDGATGIDGVTAADYEKDLEANLNDLLDRMKSGRYFAPPVRRHYIPKADGTKRPLGIPISCIMTSASTHDSQVAIPLGTLTAGRVENLYDLMDAAYDSIEIWAHCILLGHKPIIDVNPRRSVEMQEALKQEKKARRTLGLVFPEERRYVVRSGSERINGRLKDEFGGRHVRVRGYDKVLAHLMFGMTVLTASQLMRLIVPPI